MDDPSCTITTAIYRDITETINKTKFDLYVHESYQPVVHGYYLDHPDIQPIHIPDAMEQENICFTRLPLKNIIDLLATGQEFFWRYSTDIPKAEAFLRAYVSQFDGIVLDSDPEQKAFLDKAKQALDRFHKRAVEQKLRKENPPKKRLSIAERIQLLGL